MYISDEFVLILLGLVVIVGLVLLAVIGFGARLIRRGNPILGWLLIGAVIGGVTGPGLSDRLHNIALRADVAARNILPDQLDLTGKRVLFIHMDNDLCEDLCRDLLGIGTDLMAYSARISQYPDTLSDNPIGDLLRLSGQVNRLYLKPAGEDHEPRFVDVLSPGGAPPFDVVIVEGFILASVAPALLGDPLPADVNVQYATLVFTDWPDPFAVPPPAPTYRSVYVGFQQRALIPIPILTNSSTVYPDYADLRSAWARAICGTAGLPENRDEFTYQHLCTPT
jgi:hypothetical protein